MSNLLSYHLTIFFSHWVRLHLCYLYHLHELVRTHKRCWP